MNENSPLSQPNDAICPNCGAPQNSGATICSNCGAPLQVAKPSFARKAFKGFLVLILSLLAMAIGAFGACAGLIAVIGNSDPSGAYGSGATQTQFILWGVGIVAAMAFCAWLIRLVNEKL